MEWSITHPEPERYYPEAWELEELEEVAAQARPVATIKPRCSQCIHWREARHYPQSDGTVFMAPACCKLRAEAELPQMSQDYAENCHFYVEDCPF